MGDAPAVMIHVDRECARSQIRPILEILILPSRLSRSDLLQALAFVMLMLLVGWGITLGAGAMPYRWQWNRVLPYVVRVIDGEVYAGPLIRGLGVSLRISALGFGVTIAAGLAAALLLLSGSVVGRGLARAYVEIIRNTPLLVQLYLFYFVLAPILGIGREATGVLALGLFEGAFAAEIIRAGILVCRAPRPKPQKASGWGVGRFIASLCCRRRCGLCCRH